MHLATDHPAGQTRNLPVGPNGTAADRGAPCSPSDSPESRRKRNHFFVTVPQEKSVFLPSSEFRVTAWPR